MSRLAKVWYDDPDAQYKVACARAEAGFSEGILSGRECGIAMSSAQRSRDEAKAANAEDSQ